jgi:hypothetical protein
MPDMWDNAKVEQIICAGLKPVYDGSPDKLIQTMNLMHIRHKNEVWCPATYIMKGPTKIDMVLHFSQVDRETVLQQAKQIWDARDASMQCHIRGTTAYNHCLLVYSL